MSGEYGLPPSALPVKEYRMLYCAEVNVDPIAKTTAIASFATAKAVRAEILEPDWKG
jgi:hypothetical protein